MNETIGMLQELLEQNQFELLIPEEPEAKDIRLVYLMNDAVESFLIFRNAHMTGTYKSEYEGELEFSLSHDEKREEYILSVWQGDSVVTVWFRKLELEAHLYNYGAIGHFWVKGWEYLRQLEYRIAILRDKYEYLGPEFCTPGEQKIALLCDFPPLNCSCSSGRSGKISGTAGKCVGTDGRGDCGNGRIGCEDGRYKASENAQRLSERSGSRSMPEKLRQLFEKMPMQIRLIFCRGGSKRKQPHILIEAMEQRQTGRSRRCSNRQKTKGWNWKGKESGQRCCGKNHLPQPRIIWIFKYILWSGNEDFLIGP